MSTKTGDKLKGEFDAEYKKLNKAQRDAVDSINGPVMVVAGPGTGKTQILALRIGNILKQTDVHADGILCLTFTNSAVEAMRERLVRYIGEAGQKVNIFTFHSFGFEVIKKYFKVLGFVEMPKLLDETEAAVFFDEILNTHDWDYLRPRADATRYFKDLKSLISLLKRERISLESFISLIEKEINSLKDDEDSVSTRGRGKGGLKKEVEKEIEGLEKSKEIARFLEIYEETKRAKNMLDYDDVLENLVKIIEISKEALSEIRENYLYVLVDEHQDSSRVQNEFLSRVWGGLESPDIFVVGDDRQLIYGFSGASIDHFKGFIKIFPKAKLIPLVENYRSTQIILDAAHALLKSALSEAKLSSQSKESHPIKLVEAATPKEEILAAAEDLKKKIKEGLDINSSAILVPKNVDVRKALEILHDEGLQVSWHESLSLFEQRETEIFLRVLKIIDSGDASALVLSFFDVLSGITPIEAHKFIAGENMREFSLSSMLDKPNSLFESSAIEKWISKISKWEKYSENKDLKSLIQNIGKELFDDDDNKKLVSGEEISETLLSLLEKRPEVSLHDFVLYLERLQSYGEFIEIKAKARGGVKVLTMHSSKGLEFDYVWIAHMDERSLSGSRRIGFVLPESIKERIEERDIDAVKRKLFVAITRAKRFCTLSYAFSKKGRDQELAKIIAELPEEVFEKSKIKIKNKKKSEKPDLSELLRLVRDKYKDRYVSASLLNNFFECPWKWYFENLLQLPKPPAEILEFGSAVHDSIDNILKMPNLPSAEEVEKIVKEATSRVRLLDERVKAQMRRGLLKIVFNWVDTRLPEIKLSRRTEEPVSVSSKDFPHLKIFGKIDLIENLSGKEVRVTDFKTGSVKKKYEIEKIDEEGRMSGQLRQLSMYAYLLEENPKWQADVREVRLEFLEAKNIKESIYDRVIKSKDIDLLLKDIGDYDSSIKQGDWVDRPCNYNSYGKNTECEYCKRAQIFTGIL